VSEINYEVVVLGCERVLGIESIYLRDINRLGLGAVEGRLGVLRSTGELHVWEVDA
jgi:hypothetical protein